MLPPFIIDEIRKREKQARDDQPRLELPLIQPHLEREPEHQDGRPRETEISPWGPFPGADGDEAPERGVIVVDL